MFIPEIPNNSLTEEITQIVELSKKLEDEGFKQEDIPKLREAKYHVTIYNGYVE